MKNAAKLWQEVGIKHLGFPDRHGQLLQHTTFENLQPLFNQLCHDVLLSDDPMSNA
jgi:hypothetical protein